MPNYFSQYVLRYSSCWPLAILFLFLSSVTPARAESAAKLEYFEKHVRPLLIEHCYSCHSAEAGKIKGSLRLDHRGGLLQGGDSGPAIEPGQADGSLLLEAVRYESYEMPPKGKLSDKEIGILEQWVNDGAVWPEEQVAEDTAEAFDLEQRRAEHWMWQPVKNPALPAISDSSWPRAELDHFILARLEANSLRPAADVDREGLIRRLYFDLIGLPPTPEEVQKYLTGDRAAAIEQLVGDLLASPHFGERWGRHWLDLVRYAESRGHEFDNDARNAFQYRDYVIRALNEDVPYDQFVREHLAGDLLDPPRLNPEQGFNESILGTGFWFLGEWVHSPVDIRKDEADRFDNMIDVMSKTFLGVTVSCARCHDHKFDAISTADYYALSGYLQSCDYRQVRFESIEQNRRVARKLKGIDSRYQQQVLEMLAASAVELPALPEVPASLTDSIVFDFGSFGAQPFLQDGFVYGDRPVLPGEPLLRTVGDVPQLEFAPFGAVASDPFWRGLKSHSEKGVHTRSRLAKLPRSGRTFRSPTFEVTHPQLICRLRGAGHVVVCVDSHRLIAGPLHGQTIREAKPEHRSVTFDLSRYVGHRVHLEFTPADDTSFAVSRVLMGPSAEALKELDASERQAEQAMQAYSEAARQLIPDAILKEWAEERARLRNEIQLESAVAMAMLDGTGEDDHILIRGNSARPGPKVPRRFLTAIAGEKPMEIARGSGRLELAAAVNSPDNPLTHRVIVNRIWHHLMGRGIVPTTDDFGVLGQRPTHPELLDHLASQFLAQERSLKEMIRYIALSRSYQMGSQPSDKAREHDPSNQLFHHHPLRRLEGEVIRDSLLALSGRLDRKQFGEPIPVHLTPFMQGRGRPPGSGPVDGAGRRSIYLAVRRNFLLPFMLAFDTPVPFSSMGSRTSSNVPAQALILMNDPFVVQQAHAWADRVIGEYEGTEARIVRLYETAFARQPTPAELTAAQSFVDTGNDVAAWRDLAHALVNTKEFIFIK